MFSALPPTTDLQRLHRRDRFMRVSDNRCVSFAKADQHRADRSAIDPTPKLREINYLPTCSIWGSLANGTSLVVLGAATMKEALETLVEFCAAAALWFHSRADQIEGT